MIVYNTKLTFPTAYREDGSSSQERHYHSTIKRKGSPSMLDAPTSSSAQNIRDVDRRLILPIPKRPRIASGITPHFELPEASPVANPPPRFKKRRETSTDTNPDNDGFVTHTGPSGSIIAIAPSSGPSRYRVSFRMDNDKDGSPREVVTLRYGGLVDSDFSVD